MSVLVVKSINMLLLWSKGAVQKTQKSAAVFAVRRANYTHRRKGVFNEQKYR